VSSFMRGVLRVLIGKELLCSMLWIMFYSCMLFSLFNCYVLSLLYKNLTAADLCCGGWFDVYGMMVSVNVGFLKIENFILSFVR
jgi:hypothetical protein